MTPPPTSSTPLTPDDFPAFFQALWGYAPFDWQTRLLNRVHSEGWPSILDLPTGSGKTAVLDVALFALALDAFAATNERRHSRRITLVVDRRVVVDQAYKRAVNMARALIQDQGGVLQRVAIALRMLSGDSEALPVLPAILRGGMPRESEWARTPSQPVILVSTVDQVGSRLLFRGYGVSDRMKPVHAGLLGRDTLYLLDEVHLARPFEETLKAIARWYTDSETGSALLPRPLALVRMSATVADERDETFFGLEETDRKHETLSERLSASKTALLRSVTAPRDPVKAAAALAKAAVAEVERLGKGSPRAVAVIVNRVNTARLIAALAEQRLGKSWNVQLLTGRMRPLDRMQRQGDLLERVRSGRTRNESDERVLLVSTQAIEAGADFDFDALVTECASLDALRQRFGRLDRLGQLTASQAVVLAASSAVDDKAEADPIYGEALRNTWRWLNDVGELSAEQDARLVDFGIDKLASRLDDLDPEQVAAMLAPRNYAPILVGSYLDRWVQTSPAPSADPDIASFLHGIGRGAPEVQIVWRADLEGVLVGGAAQAASATTAKTGKALSPPFVRSLLEAVRPSALESLSVPLWTAKRWLAAVASRRARGESADMAAVAAALTDLEGAGPITDADVDAIAPVVIWRDSPSIAKTADELNPGDTLIVPSSYGGLDAFGCWDPEATEPVRDRGDEAQLLQRGKAIIRWEPAVIHGWADELPEALRKGPSVTPDDVSEQGAQAERVAFRDWRRAVLAEPSLPQWVRVTLEALSKREVVLRFENSAFRTARSESEETAGASFDDAAQRASEPAIWRATWTTRRVPAAQLRTLLALPSLGETQMAEAGSVEAATEGDDGSFLGTEVTLTQHLQGVRELAGAFAKAVDLPEALACDVGLAGWLHDLGKVDRRFQILLHGGDPVREASASEPIAKSAVSAGDRAARERARARSGYPRGTRHELMSVALVEANEALRARAHDWDLVLHLVASHHGWCRPFGPPVIDDSPLEVRTSFEGIELVASSNHCLSRVDSGVADRFWRLVRRYGWWGLAWLEAIVRLADHRESEREVAKETDNE